MTRVDYLVKARARTGKLVATRVTAVSESDALSRIRALGLAPLAVDVVNTGLRREIHLGKGRVTIKDLAIFSRQFGTMLAAGLPILRALSILSEQAESRRLSVVLLELRDAVESGSPLSDALGAHEEFPAIMVSMVRAGELGGFLDDTLDRVADSLEADLKLRGRIKSALTYPVAVAVIAVVITIGMLAFVVPIFAGMFASFGGELPLPTAILVRASDFIKSPVVFIPAAGILGGFALWFRRNRGTERVRRAVDPLKLRMPVFGELFRKVAIARLSRNLSTLLAAGVPILSALDIVGATSGNVVISDALADVKDSVRQGTGMAKPLSQHPVFPDMVVQMISVGEDSGAVDSMLARVADFYDREVEATTEQLMALIEPIMILGLGGLVGGMIIAMYLPIFKIFELIK